MEISSVKSADVPGGVELETRLDGEAVRVFVVVAPPDLEVLPDILPGEIFGNDHQIHANAVSSGDDIEDKLLEVVENMSPGDVAVFLCQTDAVGQSVQSALGIGNDMDD